MMVRVYWNLHRKLWSVQDAKTRRVIGHARRIILDGCEFKISEKGRQRVIREGKKNVHAFAVGPLLHADWAKTDRDDPPIWGMGANSMALHICQEQRPVTYNPYKRGAFVIRDTESEVWYSAETYFARLVMAPIPAEGKAPRVSTSPRVYTTVR